MFTRFSPLRAIRDLRVFLSQRPPFEVVFLFLAMAITAVFIFAFAHDSHEDRVYRPDIIYVQQWPADRTDAQIIAQQKIDQAAKDKQLAAEEAQRKKVQADYKKLDDRLKGMGI